MKVDNIEGKCSPKSAAIITTYKCTAECKDCCFSCSPRENEKLSLEEIKVFIDEIAEIESIKTIIWTGGECSTLGKTLLSAISYAFSKGMVSRIVSNASWSKGLEKDMKFLLGLKNSGLVELNLSTGDQHLKFIPIEKILTAAHAAVKIGLRVLISIEKTKTTKFSLDTLKENEIYKKLKKDDGTGLFSALEATWISFNSTNSYEYDEQAFLEKRKGCDSLYGTIALNPKKEILSCCGLPIRYMPEMTLGRLGEKSLQEMYNEQLLDFMKQWLYAEGPMAILDYVKKWDSKIKLPRFVHPCQACAFIYQSSEVIKAIQDNYQSVVEIVSEKFVQKLTYNEIFEQKLSAEIAY
ncbi:MAG: hypothetical protein FWE43_02390 [Streptococcaceae bacterium]|nr:hypothetical protein [Streptococcaceae bacterium]